MTLFLIFTPVLLTAIYALYGQYKRHFTTGFVTLFIVTIVTVMRFSFLALDFSGAEMTPLFKFLEEMSGLYIIPTLYMFLCDQCGTRWNNHQAKFMLLIPLLVLFYYPPIELGTASATAPEALQGILQLYNNGTLVTILRVDSIVVLTECLTLLYCMIRLWRRVKNYGLEFTPQMTTYYVWMFILHFALGYSHATNLYTINSNNLHYAFFVFYAILLSSGYILVPYSFRVAPIVEKDTKKPVAILDNFIESNKHLANHLHQLIEEDRIYLQPGLKIEDAANIMGTNRTYVTRLMHQEFGQTFSDYINSARVVYSKKLLLTSSMTLEEIAQASGFTNASAYCRVFKRITGTTPTSWKNEQG